jgi:gliding motility-associated-like protein
MKKILLALTVVFSLPVFAQSITVSTDTYTVPQLVNDVLINSSCVQGSNISSTTGSNFGSVNGIGYFQNTNPNFPMASGVVLTTGNALQAPGPNTSILSEGGTGWPGDSSLENTMAAAGIPMVSTNATVLEFDFTPISSQFSFDFVFASEEYGNYQCQFSDAFAFLLTNDITGVTTNLAVVPGTSTPISVVTIRDFLYNSSCPSQNSQYFGSYNGGSAALGSATNFNGQTTLLNASAVLTPNTPYHIKLVIADRTDYQSDSAIFLGTNSFNIGQDVLGPDLTTAQHTAICRGTTYTLNTGLDPAIYTFSWTKNGVAVAGATGPTLDITQPATYGVVFDNITDPCPALTDSIIVQYYGQIAAPDPVTLYKCNTGALLYDYNLAANTPVVSAGLSPTIQVSYFASDYNAQNNIDPLPLTYTAASGTTVYVRVYLPSTGCYVVKSFLLSVSAPPVANTPPDLTKCEKTYGSHNANFVLSTQNAAALNGQSSTSNTVTYYSSLANAQAGVNPLPNTYNNVVNNTVVYVRVQNASDPTCFSTSSFTIYINPLPPVDTLADMVVCENYVLPALVNGNYFTGNNGSGTPLFAGNVISTTQTIYIFNQPGGPPNCANNSHFKITVVNPATMTPPSSSHCGSYALPSLQYGGYFTQAGGQGQSIPAGTVISSTQLIYYYFMSTTVPVCTVDTSFIVTILPEPTVASYPDVFDCTSYTLPALPTGNNYYTGQGGSGTLLPAGTVLTTSQIVYVFVQSGTTPNCTAEDSFNVVIGFTPPVDVVQCSPYTLPALSAGGYYSAPGGNGSHIPAGTVISTSQTVYVYVPGDSDCVVDVSINITIAQPPVDTLQDQVVCISYTLPDLVNGSYFTATNGGGTALQPGDIISSNQTIYIRNTIGGCSNESHFTVSLNPLPAIDSRASIEICNGTYTLTPLAVGNYYTLPAGQGNQLEAGDVITTSQTIYIYAQTANAPFCSVENSFDISILNIEADTLAPVTICDSYTLQPLNIGNYFALSGGAATPGNVMLHAGDILTQSQLLYIYTESGERSNCFDENTFQVTINHTPDLSAITDIFACNSYTLPTLAAGDYYTGPGKTGSHKNPGDVLTTDHTLYVYAETGTTPNCAIEKSFHITVFNVADLPDVTTCDAFTLPTLTVGSYFTGPNGTGSQLTEGSAITSSQTVYVYAPSPFTPTCYDETSFNVVINHTPDLSSVTDVFACNSYTLPVLAAGDYYTGPGQTGTHLNAGDIFTDNQSLYVYAETGTTPNCAIEKNFNITVFNVADLPDVTTCDAFTLPIIPEGEYYTGSGGTGTHLAAESIVTSSQTIYVYAPSPFTPTCYDETSFNVVINHTPDLSSVTDVFACNSYTLPTLATGDYYTGPGQTGTHLNPGETFTTNQSLYVYAETGTTPNCAIDKNFNITIFNVADLADVTTCDAYSLPTIPVGEFYTGSGGTGTHLPAASVITSSQTIYVYAPSPFTPTCYDETSFDVVINHTPDLSFVTDIHACNSFTFPVLPVGDYYTGPGKTGTHMHAGDVITTDQTYYVYAETGTTPNCFSEQSFHVTIFNVADLPDVTTCEGYNLPIIPVGEYYTGSGGTGTHLPMGSYINTSKTIYVYAPSPFTPTCYDETSFELTIVNAPVAFPVPAAETTVCDEDGTNDGITLFDLTQLDATVLGAQTGPQFNVTYYATQADATTGTNPITSTTQVTVYARVVNSLAPNCFDTHLITINVKKLPAPAPIGGTLCYDPATQTVVNPYTIYSGLSSSGYTFEWKNEAGEIVGTANSYTAEAGGVYTVVATSTATGCSSAPTPVTVVQSQPALVSYATSNDFSDNMSITVTAEGSGQYQYLLDNGNFQDSPVFENVASGEHTIIVRDLNGCAEVTIKAMVINYPHYFTPNGDGIHDTWNITDLRDQPESKIYIFDRYGKLITQIMPNQPGWDGTMNGRPLPSTDYWFTVNYTEEGTEKEFRAHFAMKR